MGRVVIDCSFPHSDMRHRCAALAPDLLPSTRPRMHRARADRARLHRRTAASPVFRPHSGVQEIRRRRAAHAALARPCRLRCAPGARLAGCRSRERMRGAEASGQIKGAARRAPHSQSARGLATAPRGATRVPCRHRSPRGCWRGSVPFAINCVTLRRKLHRG